MAQARAHQALRRATARILLIGQQVPSLLCPSKDQPALSLPMPSGLRTSAETGLCHWSSRYANGTEQLHHVRPPGVGLTFEDAYEFKSPEREVCEMAGVSQKDISALYMYDAFSTNLWMVLERFGFCPPGETHKWVDDYAGLS